jgi:hypothetical protein
MEIEELTVLTGWAEGVTEALAYAPARARSLITDAHAGAEWRNELGIPDPSSRLSEAIDSIGRALDAATPTGGMPSLNALLSSVSNAHPNERDLDRLTRRVLRSTLEQLCSRRSTERHQT